MYKLLSLLLFLLLAGCSSQNASNRLAEQLTQQPPEAILNTLQDNEPDTSDIAQYYLNLGYLQLISGSPSSAIESLTAANKEMQLLSATSVSETLAAGTVNETFRRYSGYPTDRVMVHNMLALSYLFTQDIEGARVEMLQADIEMKKLVNGDALNGQLASTHLLTGIIYELLDERSNAFISYRFAEEVLTDRRISIPQSLQLALLRMSDKMGNDEQYRHYRHLYPSVSLSKSKKNKVFSLYFDGVVDHKRESTVIVPSFRGQQLIRVSVPNYPKRTFYSQGMLLSDGQQQVGSGLIEDVNSIVREDLDKEYPSILLLTTTRAVAKYQLVKEAQKQDPLLGAILNMTTLVSEVADVRSWNMLPASIQFSYLETNSDKVAIQSAKHAGMVINLDKAGQHVILATGLSEKVFHYQQ